MEETYELKERLAQFKHWQFFSIILNTENIQLTEGCSNCCPDCGLGAKPGVRAVIPYDYLEELANKFKPFWKFHNPNLYYASDPFDYESQGRYFRDVYDLFETRRKTKTGVPSGKEEQVLENLDIIQTITIRRDRKEKMKDFIREAEERIRKHPKYKVKIRDDSEWIKLGEKHINDLSDTGISNFHGVILTPREIYSHREVIPSREHPYGFIQTPVTPDNFRIAALCVSPGIVKTGHEFGDKLYDEFLNRSYYEIDSQEKTLHPAAAHLLAFRIHNLLNLYNSGTLEWTEEKENIGFLEDLRKLKQNTLETFRKTGKNDFTPLEAALFYELDIWIKVLEHDIENCDKQKTGPLWIFDYDTLGRIDTTPLIETVKNEVNAA